MLLQKYDQIFHDQINAGMIEEVNTEGLVGKVTYLPHKEVIRNGSTTTKVRIVVDASATLKTEKSKRYSVCWTMFKPRVIQTAAAVPNISHCNNSRNGKGIFTNKCTKEKIGT